MKSKLYALLLIVLMLVSFAACSEGSAVDLDALEAATGINDSPSEDEEYVPVIPKAVLELSEEDDILLNGELKDGVYTNRYFGLKFTTPEGMTLSRLNDDATDTTTIIPLRQAYEDGYGGIMITTELGLEESVFIRIYAIDDDKIGFTEDELVRAQIQETNDLAVAFGLEGSAVYGTAVLAGEKHPIQIDTSEPETVSWFFHINKGAFMYDISITAPDEARAEYLISFFEKV